MNRKTIAMVWLWAAFALCAFTTRSAYAQNCVADSDCAAGATCLATAATGCTDSCANSGGCVDIPCDHYIKTCAATCFQDTDCDSGKYCQFTTATFTCPSASGGSGGTSGSSNQGCTEALSFGQCIYHQLGSLPDGGSGGVSAVDTTSPAGAPNEAVIAEEGGSAGQASATPVKQGATPSAGTPSSVSGGCAIAFGASDVSSAGLLLLGLGAVVARRRRAKFPRE